MCADCDAMATDHIIDYVALCNVPLEVAILLERDATVQNALRDRVGDEAVQIALEVSDTVVEAGERLKFMREFLPKTYMALIEMAQKERVP